MLHPIYHHEEGHAERVNVKPSAEDLLNNNKQYFYSFENCELTFKDLFEVVDMIESCLILTG